MQTVSVLQVLVKPGQPQVSDIQRLTPFLKGQISNKKMYNVCCLYLEWLKFLMWFKKNMVCARLNENIKQTLWMQTGAEEGTLQEENSCTVDVLLLHCTSLVTHCTKYLVYQILQTTLLTILPPPTPHNIKLSTLSVKGKGPVIPYPPSLQSILKAPHYW